MEFSMEPVETELARTVLELEKCNRISERYGLSLTHEQMRTLAESRHESLQSTGRVEFGAGIFKPLVYTFCDSPYLTQEDYPSALADLQELFYQFKNGTGDLLGDDELLGAMRAVFDGPAHGAMERLADTPPEELYRIARGGGVVEDAGETEEDADEE